MAKNAKRHSVSLLLMTDWSFTLDKPAELTAVLQERGRHNFETGEQESWLGLCQLTAHGGVEPDEDDRDALWREISEELGQKLLESVFVWQEGPPISSYVFTDAVVKVGQAETSGKVINHYAIKVSPKELGSIQLHSSSGGLRLVRQKEVGNILDACNPKNGITKVGGVDSRRVIAMFPDEIEALKAAFKLFGKAEATAQG